MSKLRISDTLALPMDAVTQTFAVLAKRGVGKTYLASVMAEEMLKAGQQIVAIDPTGAWWGLRSAFPVVILGGEHADVPLEESAGEVVAQAIVENRFPAVIDLSLFRKGQMIRFMTTFAETLYRLNREPVHLFVDEADAVAPQAKNYGGDENRMLGAMEDIVRRGRKRGIGCTLITQRPAVLNKNVLTQCEILISLRLVHPKDIDAIEEWVNVHADPAQAKAMIVSLPSLPIGTAWFWSPGWGDIFQRVKIRERETFDSGATPKPGESPRRPKRLAEIDLNALGGQIKATVEKAKANDPRHLQSELARLRKELAERPITTPEPRTVERIVEVPVLKNGQLDRTEKAASRMEAAIERLVTEAAELRRLIAPAAAPRPVPAVARLPVAVVRQPAPRSVPTSVRRSTGSRDGALPKGERAILIAVAQYPDGAEREQLTVLTGYKRSSRDAYLQRLRERGYIAMDGDRLTPTDDGMTALGSDFEPLPTGDALREYWIGRLPEGERRILEVLIGSYPNAIPRDDLDGPTGYKRSSRDAYLQRLSARKLVQTAGRGEVRASEELFA